MSNPPAEQGIARSLALAHMRIESVARQRREPFYVLDGDLALAGFEGVTQLEIVEWNAKGMHAGITHPAAARPSVAGGRDGIGRALYRGALHVVQNSAYSSHLLAASGAAGPAMSQLRKRRAVARRFLRTSAVHHQHASMIRRQASDQS